MKMVVTSLPGMVTFKRTSTLISKRRVDANFAGKGILGNVNSMNKNPELNEVWHIQATERNPKWVRD